MQPALYSSAIELSVEIAADRECVWRALTDPKCVVVWDTGVVQPLDAPADYPKPGQIVRWRYNLSGLPMTLVDEPQKVVRLETLRSRIALGFLRFDETYTLQALDQNATRLTAYMEIGNVLPIFRRSFDHFIGRGLASDTVSASLRAIREFCERDEQPQKAAAAE